MKLRSTLIVLFLLVMLSLLVSVANTHVSGGSRVELAVGTLARGAGATIAVMAALLLLLRAASRETPEQLIPLLLVLCGGLLLFQPHWVIGLVPALVVLGVYARAIWGAGGGGQGRRGRRHVPGGSGEKRG